MKKVCTIFLLVFLTLSIFITVSAHSGGTDGNGGHYDSSAGEYHYHHGHPAHQHINGKCPYNYDDDTNHNSNSSKDAPWYVVVLVSALCVAVFVLDYKVLDGKIIGFFMTLFCGILFSPLYIIGLICTLVDWIRKKIKKGKEDTDAM